MERQRGKCDPYPCITVQAVFARQKQTFTRLDAGAVVSLGPVG